MEIVYALCVNVRWEGSSVASDGDSYTVQATVIAVTMPGSDITIISSRGKDRFKHSLWSGSLRMSPVEVDFILLQQRIIDDDMRTMLPEMVNQILSDMNSKEANEFLGRLGALRTGDAYVSLTPSNASLEALDGGH